MVNSLEKAMTTSLNRVRVCQTAPICANHTRGSTGRKGDSLMATAAIGAVHLVAVGEPSGNYRKTTERIKRWEIVSGSPNMTDRA